MTDPRYSQDATVMPLGRHPTSRSGESFLFQFFGKDTLGAERWRVERNQLPQEARERGRNAMPTHTYEARITWQAGGEGITAGNHRLEFEGRPAVEVSAAPEYRGDPTRLNPEELFVAALASCQLLTYLALARGAGVTVRLYEERATGTLAIADRKMRMTEVLLRPRITVAPGSDQGTARGLVDKAHDGCFIANSVACAVRIEPSIVVED